MTLLWGGWFNCVVVCLGLVGYRVCVWVLIVLFLVVGDFGWVLILIGVGVLVCICLGWLLVFWVVLWLIGWVWVV